MALLDEIGIYFQACLDDCAFELAIREIIRERVNVIDRIGKRIDNLLQTGINDKTRLAKLHESCTKVEYLFAELKTHYEKLSTMVSISQYDKYHDLWRITLRRNCLQVALVIYLKTERAVTRDQVANILGIHGRKEDGFHIDDSDFYTAILDMGYELAKLAMNYVTVGSYSQPVRITAFLQEIEAEYSQKTLNHSLWKKLDWFRQCYAQVCKVLRALQTTVKPNLITR